MNNFHDQRQIVKDAIESFDADPIWAEDFKEFTKSSEMAIRQRISECDGYIGIFDKRYGTIPVENNPNCLSISHLEYNFATKLTLQRLVFKTNYYRTEPQQENVDITGLKIFLGSISNYHSGQWYIRILTSMT